MPDDNPGRITRLLEEIHAGRADAADELFPLVYRELRALAGAKMAGERQGHTLQPTALVHESYLRLFGGQDVRWDSRAHFFGSAAEAMRRILVDRARSRLAAKRGGERERVEMRTDVAVVEPPADELLALDQALSRLETHAADKAAVVKLRYFAGLSVPDVARALDMSPRSVDRAWAAARAWLHREMTRAG